MSFIGEFFENIFKGEQPAVETGAARADVAGDRARTQALRSTLLGTPGGILGEELEEEDVRRRDTLFGN